jgi:hypothetical protein
MIRTAPRRYTPTCDRLGWTDQLPEALTNVRWWVDYVAIARRWVEWAATDNPRSPVRLAEAKALLAECQGERDRLALIEAGEWEDQRNTIQSVLEGTR